MLPSTPLPFWQKLLRAFHARRAARTCRGVRQAAGSEGSSGTLPLGRCKLKGGLAGSPFAPRRFDPPSFPKVRARSSVAPSHPNGGSLTPPRPSSPRPSANRAFSHTKRQCSIIRTEAATGSAWMILGGIRSDRCSIRGPRRRRPSSFCVPRSGETSSPTNLFLFLFVFVFLLYSLVYSLSLPLSLLAPNLEKRKDKTSQRQEVLRARGIGQVVKVVHGLPVAADTSRRRTVARPKLGVAPV